MKEGFRQSQAWLHTWAGLIVGWLLFVIFITGTLSFFRDEITYWMHPELHHLSTTTQQDQTTILNNLFQQLNQRIQGSSFVAITLPSERNPLVEVNWFGDRHQHLALDPTTGDTIQATQTVGGNFFYRMHYQLWYLSPFTGRLIISFATLIMLVTVITGIITHKKIFKDYFVLRTHKGQRSWLDAHIIAGVIALPFYIIIIFSGLIILINFFMPWGTKAVYERQQGKMYQEAFNTPNFSEKNSGITQPMPSANTLIEQFNKLYPKQKISSIFIYRPNQTNSAIVLYSDNIMHINPLGVVFNNQGQITRQITANGPAAATQNTLNYLHRSHYANYWLRWLLFLSGIAGCFMIASGLILWSVKRQTKLKKQVTHQPISHRLVQVLNVSSIAGICVALPCLLLANRLLSLNLKNRSTWEVAVFFTVWGITFIYSMLHPYKKAWQTLFLLASIMCLAIPLCNAFTTQTNLLDAVTENNWKLAGIELTAIAFALFFAWLSYRVKHHINIAMPIKTSSKSTQS